MDAVAETRPKRAVVGNFRALTRSQHVVSHRKLPNSVLVFRLEQTRETLQTIARLVAQGRAPLAANMIAGAIGLINRDLGSAQ